MNVICLADNKQSATLQSLDIDSYLGYLTYYSHYFVEERDQLTLLYTQSVFKYNFLVYDARCLQPVMF